MTDDRRQRLSALVDGEGSPAELRATLAETLLDPQLSACWERYLSIGRALRGEAVSGAARGVAAAVAERLAAEAAAAPAAVASVPVPLRRAELRRRPAATSAGPILGAALAAGLATVAVVITPRLGEDGGLSRMPLAEGAAPPSALAGVQPATVDRWSIGEPKVATKLNELLVSHRERAAANGLNGLIPYAALVGYGGSR